MRARLDFFRRHRLHVARTTRTTTRLALALDLTLDPTHDAMRTTTRPPSPRDDERRYDEVASSSPTSSTPPHATMRPRPRPSRIFTHLIAPHAVARPRLFLTHLVRPSTQDDDGADSPSPLSHPARPHPPPPSLHTRRRQRLDPATSPRVVVTHLSSLHTRRHGTSPLPRPSTCDDDDSSSPTSSFPPHAMAMAPRPRLAPLHATTAPRPSLHMPR